MNISIRLSHSEGAIWEDELPYFITNYQVAVDGAEFRLRCHRQFGSDNIQFKNDKWCDVEKMNAKIMTSINRNEKRWEEIQTFIRNSVITIGNQILVAYDGCHTMQYYEIGD